MMVTLGTGIGSALFIDGELVPNTELGHLKIGKKDAEKVRGRQRARGGDLSWKQWAERLDGYFEMLDALFSPDLIIVGGGVSKKSEKFLPRLTVRTEIVPAQLLNEAGIVGAAVAAHRASPPAPDRLTVTPANRRQQPRPVRTVTPVRRETMPGTVRSRTYHRRR